MARRRKQQGGNTTQAAQTAAQWPVGGTTSEKPLVSGDPEGEREKGSSPLTPLTLDTILTVGDLQRLLKIVSSSS
jgi:hypothetical protein